MNSNYASGKEVKTKTKTTVYTKKVNVHGTRTAGFEPGSLGSQGEIITTRPWALGHDHDWSGVHHMITNWLGPDYCLLNLPCNLVSD